jgi:hypothetical protein
MKVLKLLDQEKEKPKKRDHSRPSKKDSSGYLAED